MGGILWIVILTVVGYFLGSLFSLSFHISEWNLASRIVKWIVSAADILIIIDLIGPHRNRFTN